jgi:hypothetical protein
VVVQLVFSSKKQVLRSVQDDSVFENENVILSGAKNLFLPQALANSRAYFV